MTATKRAAGFHHGADAKVRKVGDGHVAGFTFTFESFYHPFVGKLIARLNKTSVAGMLDPHFLQGLTDKKSFRLEYKPEESGTLQIHGAMKEIDVTPDGAYSAYNWELFYHIPVAIAVHLSNNQRFAEAQKWFHYVFDPTATGPGPASARCWKFIGFRGEQAMNVDQLLTLLSTPDGELTPAQAKSKEWVHKSYEAILSSPFKPHVVARARPVAYQYYVVMKYLDNLIAWGDSLFAQYTIETINEAMVSYVLCANLLGPRPQKVPSRGTVAPKNFAQLKKAGLDPMGQALVDMEGQFPFDSTLPSSHHGGSAGHNGALLGIGRSLYFCVPKNEKLLGYWDTVADRLFKIRNCMDITGVVRPLPLFDPPLDPGMLVKAAAAGLDIGSIVSGMSQPLGPLRSLGQIQKALEICGEVKALGSALLSAWEKGDGEHMALVRQRHEIAVQKMTQGTRFLQWKQAKEATESLLRSRATTLERYKYYLRLLGQTPDGTAPDVLPIDRRELTEDNFDDAFSALVEQYDQKVTTEAYPAIRWGGKTPSTQAGASGSGQLYLSGNEDSELNTHMPAARDLRIAALAPQALSAVFSALPQKFDVAGHPMGVGLDVSQPVGIALVAGSTIAAEILQTTAAWQQDQASMDSKTASYERRADDWRLQANTAARELTQMGRQVLSSLIAEQVAHHEYKMAETQVRHAQEVDHLLRSKFTNEELYGWMQGEISRIYYQYYRFAFDVARKAEQTMKRELMRPELDGTTFVQFNYWDAGRKGLLSGEALHLDLKRMEMAYHDNDKREIELTRHVSLRQLDPMALLQLKVTGACTVSIPEWLYDRDCPGHYMRRIKTVALSIPSVVGPYTSVNCTLTLQKSTVRVSPQLANGSYGRDTDDEDDRFVDYLGSVDSVVTSGASNDSGMFETNLRDERFLPFEGAGAVSMWGLALPSGLRAFDYMTISDVILHVRYTARNGGAALGAKATKELQEALADASQAGLALLFGLRFDFPTEWAAFVSGTGDFAFTLQKSYFPYVAQGGPVTVDNLVLYSQAAGKLVQATVPVPDGLVDGINGATGAGALTLPADALTRDAEAQVFLIIQYHLGS